VALGFAFAALGMFNSRCVYGTFAEWFSGSRDRAILENSSFLNLFKDAARSGKFCSRVSCFLFLYVWRNLIIMLLIILRLFYGSRLRCSPYPRRGLGRDAYP
jgi:hypothetical protein